MAVDAGKPPVESGAHTDDLAQYHLDDYDDDVNEEGARKSLPGNLSHTSRSFLTEIGPFTSIKGLTFYRDNADDPYITLKEVGPLLEINVRLLAYSTWIGGRRGRRTPRPGSLADRQPPRRRQNRG
jgi:hypothetical protein